MRPPEPRRPTDRVSGLAVAGDDKASVTAPEDIGRDLRRRVHDLHPGADPRQVRREQEHGLEIAEYLAGLDRRHAADWRLPRLADFTEFGCNCPKSDLDVAI